MVERNYMAETAHWRRALASVVMGVMSAATLLGCGRDEPLAVTSGPTEAPEDRGSETTAAAPTPQSPPATERAPERAPAATEVVAAPQPLRTPAACRDAGDCTYETLSAIEGEADCACARCPHEVGAVARAVMEARRASFRQHCRAWLQTHPCPPQMCQEPGELTCVDGGCDVQR